MASRPSQDGHEHFPQWSASRDIGGEEADPDAAAAAQLASEASHRRLSASGSNAEPPRPLESTSFDPCCLQLLDAIDSPTFKLSAAAQTCTESEESRSWQEEQAYETKIDTQRESIADTSMANTDVADQQSAVSFTLVADSFGEAEFDGMDGVVSERDSPIHFSDLPNEVLLQILDFLDVPDLLSTSRTSHHLRDLSLAPILQRLRLQRTRAMLPPMLTSPSRPSLADLISRSIFLTNTTVVSRKLARSLVSIRLQRRLAARPSAETLVEQNVLPPECVPGSKNGKGVVAVAPALVAKKRAIERERVKDGLRGWVGSVWRGEVRTREEGVRRWEERVGVGRVWRLRRFWERVAQADNHDHAAGVD